MEEGLLVSQTQKRKKNRKQSQSPSCSQSQSQIWSHSPSASPSPFPPRTHNRTAHSSNHHSSSYTQPHTHSHYSHNSNHHHSNSCLNRRKATGLAKRKAKKGLSPNRRKKRADRRAPALKRKIPVLWSRGSSLHRDRDRLWGSHTTFSLESSRDSSRETPTDETPCWAGEQRFLGRREAVTPGGQCRPMERPSKASQSRGSTWKGLLIITATILSCWIQPMSAQDLMVELKPAQGKVGDTVTLNILDYSGSALMYSWYYKPSTRNSKEKLILRYSPGSTSQTPNNTRQKVHPNGSLIIPNLVLSDSGDYKVQIKDSSSKILRARAPLKVYGTLMKPNITLKNNGIILEKGIVVFTCNTEKSKLPDIRWYFQNKNLIRNDRMTQPQTNKTLIILPVKREDSGAYQCEVWNPFFANISDSFNLTVIYGPEPIKIFPKPVHGQIEALFNQNLTLECQASSEPPAQYTWQVNGSSRAENSGNTYTISQVSWEHAGTYTCMAMNNITNSTISRNTTIRVYENLMKPNIPINSTSNIIENGTMVLTCNTGNEYLIIARENAGT
ncbi:carcinoembryonic antigen-related cell adhesion molecule 6-like isoform X2 [Monodelphis domestica]|uniref:carcinoembryonic antigen-related cell adhesion molecule 6-like isoform X2 n=1 Tax=Monodelphis domestica TaxID=13616 RepID=UPI0004435364|nr:carcinoembryonic antigen-related cell adhesion molecule 6-like isoform X2 [Monodelphis domestica]